MDDLESSEVLSDSVGDVWQVDSQWVSFPSTPTKVKTDNNNRSAQLDVSPSFFFIPAPARPGQTADRYLVLDQQALRLSDTKPSGQTTWVCSIPGCPAHCVLDANQSKILKACREHSHEAGVSRQAYSKFVHALKVAVQERPHIKPKVVYETELEKFKQRSGEEAVSLPSFEAVRLAMNNSRNDVLSSVSLRPAVDNEEAPADDGFVTPESSPAAGRLSRSTRSRDSRGSSGSGSARKKSPASRLQAGSDYEDFDDDGFNTSLKNANLSDLEDWLEDDVNANFSAQVAAVRASRGRGGITRQTHASPGRRKPSKVKAEAEEGPQQTSTPDSSFTEDSMNTSENWDGTSPLETIPKRKYRKRPASSSVFTCQHCPYKSNRHFNVQRHERLAHSTKKPEFSCKECGTSYSLEYRLKLHIKAVHLGEGHRCNICNKTFETMTGLKSHMVTKHRDQEHVKVKPSPPPPELTCKLCGRVFSTKSHLQKHTSSHIMVQPYRCCTCNQAFMEESTWLAHQASCSAAFTIQCCLCSAYLPTARHLLLHMDEVHGRAEYDCRCGKSFPWKKSLVTHQQKCSFYVPERV